MLRPLRTGRRSGAGTPVRQARPGPDPAFAPAGQLRLPPSRQPGLPAPGCPGIRRARGTNRRRLSAPALGITSNPVFSRWKRTFATPMAPAANIDRLVLRRVMLEFDVSRHRAAVGEQRGREQEVSRQAKVTKGQRKRNRRRAKYTERKAKIHIRWRAYDQAPLRAR